MATEAKELISPELGREKLRLLLPPLHIGMKTLDKTAFAKEISVPTIVVSEANLPKVVNSLKPFLLKLRKFKSIVEDSNHPKTKKIYLNPDVVTDLSYFVSTSFNVEQNSYILSSSNELITIFYENWKWDELLNSILPDGEDKVGGYTLVGSLIHLNLRQHLLPFKSIIGQVLLDGVTQAKTVVNKLQSIDNKFRNFHMEVIAGEPNTIVKLKENNIEFEFDFATVYWNSRLSSEHDRIVTGYLKQHDILFDVFAGVGPFAIPAAKKRCFVYANDLNPESHKWLAHNVEKRKVKPYVKTFNEDGRDFIRNILPKLIRNSVPSALSNDFEFYGSSGKIHVTMNLPAMAVDFLDAFWGLVSAEELNQEICIIVHIYCFIRGMEQKEYKNMAVELVRQKLRHELPVDKILEIFFVRNVAPLKDMYRVSFTLPHEILTNQIPTVNNDTLENSNTSEDPAAKRLRLDDNEED